MVEKLSEVYEKYDIDILNTRRGRGTTIISAEQGTFILEPFQGGVGRLEQEYVLKGLFQKAGFEDLDMLIPNVEGELISYDRYQQPFVLKKYYHGTECDMKNLADVVRAVEVLTVFHRKGQGIACEFQEEWEQAKQSKEEKIVLEIKQLLEEDIPEERVARMFGMTPVGLKQFMKEKEIPEDDCLKNKCVSKQRDCQEAINRVLLSMFRKNRELRKIRKYVSNVKRKNEFERLFLSIFNTYYQKGVDCEMNFKQMEMSETSLRGHYGICHGNYNQHNVLLDDNTAFITHLEKFTRGNQLDDLYQFARKVMEKNHFDYETLEIILKTYDRQIPLNGDDYRYLYVLFSYPEKFWKIANGYYNSKKSFLSPKFYEKMKKVMEQEVEKQEMLTQYYSFHLI